MLSKVKEAIGVASMLVCARIQVCEDRLGCERMCKDILEYTHICKDM